MSQYLLDCEAGACTMAPYTAPPSTVTIDHYALAPTWSLFLATGLILVFIIAIAVVRYKLHEERGMTERDRIRHPLTQCPTCGEKLEVDAA